VALPNGNLALFTDTVGFIQKLPTTLVAAFRATLEEIAEADLLLHMVDITHPNALAQAESVLHTLAEIHADHIPVLTVLNKVDLLNKNAVNDSLVGFPNAVAISALTGEGLENLLEAVEEKLFATFTPISVRLPYKEGGLIALFHDQGQVERVEHERRGMLIQGRLPGRLLAQFQPYALAAWQRSMEVSGR
jgi:GTP-binding protein HflX